MTRAYFKTDGLYVSCPGIKGVEEAAALMHAEGWETTVDLSSSSVTMVSSKQQKIDDRSNVTKFVFWDNRPDDENSRQFRWQVRYYGYRQEGGDRDREYGRGTADSLDAAAIAAGKAFDDAVRAERHYRAKARRAAAEEATNAH